MQIKTLGTVLIVDSYITLHARLSMELWPCLFPIIIGLSVEISDNPTKRLVYFRLSGNPLQRFELREARSEKRENLRFSQPRLDYKLSENKQGPYSQFQQLLSCQWVE